MIQKVFYKYFRQLRFSFFLKTYFMWIITIWKVNVLPRGKESYGSTSIFSKIMKINIYNTTFHFCKISNLVLNEIIFPNSNFFCRLLFFIKICWNCFCRFDNFITRNDWIINNTSYIFKFFGTTCSRIPNITFFAHQHLLLFHFWFQLYCFVKISFIPVIILKTSTFKFSVLLETHSLS